MFLSWMRFVGKLDHATFKNRLLLWQENQKSPKRIDNRSIRFDANDAVNCAADLVASIENLESVVFAFATLQTKG